MGIPDLLTCLLRNLYTDQEATARTGHGTSDWFKFGKGVQQGCILSPCLFNLYEEYIMQNARLNEAQAGIKIAAVPGVAKSHTWLSDWTELNWCTPFPIWNQSVVPCQVLTVASWSVYRFLRRQVKWSGIPISCRIFQFVVIHTVKGFSIVNKAEVDVFLELSCFFNDPMDVAIWSLVPLSSLNPAWTSGSS